MNIPKIIHQIWLQGSDNNNNPINIPDDYPNFTDSWKQMNKEFTYVLWDDDKIMALMKEKFPFLIQKYNSLPRFIQKVDIAKFMILYTYGGIYVDLDLECLKSVNDLL